MTEPVPRAVKSPTAATAALQLALRVALVASGAAVQAGCAAAAGPGDASEPDHTDITRVTDTHDAATDAVDDLDPRVRDAGPPMDAWDSAIDAGTQDESLDDRADACPLSCASLGATCGTLHDACGATVRCGDACAGALTVVNLDVRHLVYDATYGVLYAAIGPLDGVRPNTFTLLDPESGAPRISFHLRAPIDALGLHGDGDASFAFGIPWRNTRVLRGGDLFSLTRDVSSLRDEPLAGRAMALTTISGTDVLAIADPPDGSMGCAFGPAVGFPPRLGPSIVLDACPASLTAGPLNRAYGVARSPRGATLQVLSLSSSGASAHTTPFALSPAHDTHVTVSGDRLFTTVGPVYSLATPDAPTLAGMLPLAGGVAVDAATHRGLVFGATTAAGSNALVWRVFDADTLATIFDDGTTYTIGAAGFVAEMVRTGPSRFVAIVYPEGDAQAAELIILHVPLTAAAPGDGGVDVDAYPPPGSDAGPCWMPDGGRADPVDPTWEAQDRVQFLAQQTAAYYVAHPGTVLCCVGSPTPVPTLCRADPPGTWSGTPWAELGFGFGAGETHRYTYEVHNAPAFGGAIFTARALGDLDGDGWHSTFEVAGQVEPDGGVTLNDLWAVRPFE